MSSDSNVELAMRFAQAGDFEQAAAYLAEAVKLDPGNVNAWQLFGDTLREPEKRKFCYRRVLELDPANELARVSLGELEGALPKTLLSSKAAPAAVTVVSSPAPEPVLEPDPLPALESLPEPQVALAQGSVFEPVLTDNPALMLPAGVTISHFRGVSPATAAPDGGLFVEPDAPVPAGSSAPFSWTDEVPALPVYVPEPQTPERVLSSQAPTVPMTWPMDAPVAQTVPVATAHTPFTDEPEAPLEDTAPRRSVPTRRAPRPMLRRKRQSPLRFLLFIFPLMLLALLAALLVFLISGGAWPPM
jgi:hypothetical protein